NMEDKKLKDAYNRAAENFLYTRTEGEDKSGFWNREVEQPLMFELVPKSLKGLLLLDVGCGPGIHVKEYEKRGAKCFGVDFSEEMIKLAKERCPDSKFEVDNIYDLKFEDGSFDIVTASLALDHLKDLSKGIDEIHRVLKRDGLLIFSVPHPIGNLFGDPDKGDHTLDGNYFDRREIYLDIAGGGADFVDYLRTFQDYLDILLSKGFELLKLVENEPNEKWKKKYDGLNEAFFRMPFIYLFKFRKK
ncbi:MAG: class I SAM-dependent methyltransferase, partial [Candidatus Hodarchaeota archaeon]